MKIKLVNGKTIAKVEQGKVYTTQRYFKRINLALREYYNYFVIVESL
jgi:hypothetical protein